VAVTAIIVAASFMVAAVYYFLHRGTEVSGLEKRYKTAREASYGGLDVFTKEILPKAISGLDLSSVVSGFATLESAKVEKRSALTDACFRSKLLSNTANWSSTCGGSTLDPKANPDITFTLSGKAPSSPFTVSTKIVDTVAGNSDRSGITLEGQGTAESQSGMITVQHFPYLYRIEVTGERTASPEEKAGLTVLYAY
jgi:hypothetical protein